jgi:hypothetical protein
MPQLFLRKLQTVQLKKKIHLARRISNLINCPYKISFAASEHFAPEGFFNVAPQINGFVKPFGLY